MSFKWTTYASCNSSDGPPRYNLRLEHPDMSWYRGYACVEGKLQEASRNPPSSESKDINRGLFSLWVEKGYKRLFLLESKKDTRGPSSLSRRRLPETLPLWVEGECSKGKPNSDKAKMEEQLLLKLSTSRSKLIFFDFVKSSQIYLLCSFNSFLLDLMLENPIWSMATWADQTLCSFGPVEILWGDSWKSERENFGVQQLPLFNLLKPEELDWGVLPFETRR